MVARDEIKRTVRRRNNHGHAISEFGASMAVFICLVLAPLIDLSFIPVRYLVAQGVVVELTHRLALTERRTDAYTLLDTDLWWKVFLDNCGVTVHNPKLRLIACGQNSSQMTTVNNADEDLTAEWLPEGSKGPCVYSLELSADCDLPPLFSLGVGIPGFTGPVTIPIKARSQWENLGRDPQTGNYYINL